MNDPHLCQETLLATPHALNTTLATTSGNETGIQPTPGASGEACALLACSAGAGTSPSLTIKLQDSDDDVTYTDMLKPDGSVATFVAVTTAASEQKIPVNVNGLRKYMRVVRTVSGTVTTGWSFSVHVLLGGYRNQPIG